MDSDFDPKLEALIHAQLRQLPPCKAPATLAPRVLAAVADRAARPWWRQAWWHWPWAAKLAFVVTALAVAGCMAGGSWALDQPLRDYFQEVAAGLSVLGGWVDNLRPLADALVLLWQKFCQPWFLYALAGLAAIYLLCIGTGTAFVRVAAQRAWTSHT